MGHLVCREMGPEDHEELRCQSSSHSVDLKERVPKEKPCPKKPHRESPASDPAQPFLSPSSGCH